ncbi:hypothetical protein A3F62_01490 [Candidatus Woesebacteria bacterium RIFCSPHIGHO2_12_FULL_44_11]|nr:MAG: hypothetical protein A3F62_01490 [Candidatus Woesebacteria bacterium RIFCSPHIGHO2_12_FULL_44_11]
MSIIFDVGANNGNSTIDFAKASTNNIVYAFEPNPELCDLIKEKTANLPNYILIPKAVSDFNGISKFNITPRHGQVCSSLFDYTDNINIIWGRIAHRFEVTKTINVMVTTMERFIEEQNIPIVDYLHCDAQGADLKILKSFSKYLNLLQSGVVETSRLPETSTYKVDNTFDSLKKFLMGNNFEITDVDRSDRREWNVYFKKND